MADKKNLDPAGGARPQRGVRWRRIFGTLLALALVGGGVYVASWLNARRYFLIVEATEVRVARGRMLPVGHQPFVPVEPELRRAYESFPLPGGIKLPRGESTFDDRVELDQALFRVLKDAIAFSLMEENRRTTELVARYLKQVKAIPGTSVAQQLELASLERDAAYHDAREHLNDGVAALREAARLFHESARGQGGREKDGELRARAVEAVLEHLASPTFGSVPAPVAETPVRTATTATATTTPARNPLD